MFGYIDDDRDVIVDEPVTWLEGTLAGAEDDLPDLDDDDWADPFYPDW